MSSFNKFGDVSVWANKYDGNVKLHMKQGKVKGDRAKYLNIQPTELQTLYTAVMQVLGGKSEGVVRPYVDEIPLTFYGPTKDKATYDLVLGGEKAGYDHPLSKISFPGDKDTLKEFLDYLLVAGTIMDQMEKSEQENISRMALQTSEKRKLAEGSDGEGDSEGDSVPKTPSLIHKDPVPPSQKKKAKPSKTIGKEVKDQLKKVLKFKCTQ